MPFTNDDLKRLKEHVKNRTGSDGISINEETALWMEALLARLEAAEAMASFFQNKLNGYKCMHVEARRKTARK